MSKKHNKLEENIIGESVISYKPRFLPTTLEQQEIAEERQIIEDAEMFEDLAEHHGHKRLMEYIRKDCVHAYKYLANPREKQEDKQFICGRLDALLGILNLVDARKEQAKQIKGELEQ